MSPFIVIGAWKAAKRRSRRTAARTADRISGGWDELTDRAVDYGARLTPGRTRPEEAAAVVATLAVPRVADLAERADVDVFGPTDPTPEDVEAFWSEVDAIVGGLGEDAGFWKRIKARLSLRSLLGGTAISTRSARAPRGGDRARAARIRARSRAATTHTPPHPRARPHDAARVRADRADLPPRDRLPHRRLHRGRSRDRPRRRAGGRRHARRPGGDADHAADRRARSSCSCCSDGSSCTR